MDATQHEFEAVVELHDFGRMAYSVVYLPNSIVQKLPLAETSRPRVRGEINGAPFDGACNPAGEGRYYFILSKKYLKTCKSALGEQVFVTFSLADQDAVDVPTELRFALQANGAAERAWDKLTPGKQRGFAYRVASAKRPETRERRVEEVIDALVEGKPLR